MGGVEISRHLLKNFEAFADPKNKEYITRDSLLDAAYPRRNSSFTPQNTAFARELLSRHDLMDKLDGDRKGNLEEKSDTSRSDAKLENENPIDIGQMSLEERMYDLQRKFALAIFESHTRNA